MAKRSFKDLYFGLASAEAEVAHDQERFLRTYYDRWDLGKRLASHDFFLIVGPKGAGKTALSEFMRLKLASAAGHDQVFHRTLNLDEVSPGLSPLSTISQKLVSDQAAGITDTAWRLFISLRLFELLVKDQGGSLVSDPHALRLANELADAGLAESDFPSVLRRVRENKLSFSLKGVLGGERTTKSSDEVPVAKLGDALMRLVLDAKSESHFLLAIDGLDRIIGDNRAYWLTLAALLRVGDDLHQKLRSARSDVRLFVMCRSDVFRRIRFADSDKIAGDSAMFIDWGAQQTVPLDSPLWDYLSAKAELSPAELFEYFPKYVSVGLRGSDTPRNIPVAEYLLQSTRSTPREMTMLMRRLQEELPRSGYLTSERVRMAVDNFSSRDLLTTVAAEATGMLDEELDEKLEEILSGLPSATNLKWADVESSVVQSGLAASHTGTLCEFLFLAGLLGNYDPRTGYVQFYHRRDTYRFKRQGPWQLHRGLMYAFNIPYSAGPA